jgi:putative ABC transport system permease protein
MITLALKMLIGNKASCLGVIFGIFLATLLISQQSAIFLGLVSRSYRMVTDIPAPNLWVVDPSTESDEKVRGMPESYVDIVRSMPGIEWASPIAVTYANLVSQSGIFHVCHLYGLDDASLVGAPPTILEGNMLDLRREGAVIVDVYSANGILATTALDGSRIPLKLGDTFEINDHHAVVVGICKVTQSFYPQPIVFTSLSQFKRFTSLENYYVGFIAAKSRPGEKVEKIINEINSHYMLNGLTSNELEWRMAKSFLKTGILINFGLSVALGIIIGFSIAGQIFYTMTLQNLMYYALIKAIGGNEKMIYQMISVQTAVVSIIGFLLGIGATLVWGSLIKDTTLAFMFPWQLLAFTGFIVLIIALFTAGLSIHKVLKTDPKILMGN